MGYNKYLWGAEKKEKGESFGQVQIAPINETTSMVFEAVIHFGAGHKCEIAEKVPDEVVPKALYTFSINYYSIYRISGPEQVNPEDGILVETRRIINKQMNLYGHTRYYLVKTII